MLAAWGRPDVSWVHDISWRIWARSWQDQPCCVIPENVPGCCPDSYLHVQVSRGLHELPQILSTNSFGAQNQSESFYNWTIKNHDLQHYFELSTLPPLTVQSSHLFQETSDFSLFLCIFLLILTLHKATLATWLDVTLPSQVYILYFMYIFTERYIFIHNLQQKYILKIYLMILKYFKYNCKYLFWFYTYELCEVKKSAETLSKNMKGRSTRFLMEKEI